MSDTSTFQAVAEMSFRLGYVSQKFLTYLGVADRLRACDEQIPLRPLARHASETTAASFNLLK